MKESNEKKISLRLESKLYLRIEQKAVEKNVNISTAIRKLIHMGLEEKKVYLNVEPIIYELHDFGGIMARLGGNLNQIAHYFNMTNTVNETELKLVHKALQIKFKEIATQLKIIKHKLIDERDAML